jgi:hypothetical protein
VFRDKNCSDRDPIRHLVIVPPGHAERAKRSAFREVSFG